MGKPGASSAIIGLPAATSLGRPVDKPQIQLLELVESFGELFVARVADSVVEQVKPELLAEVRKVALRSASQSPYISLPDLAKMCGVSTRTIRRYIEDGTLPSPANIGTKMMWRSGDLDAFFVERSKVFVPSQP